MKKTFYMLASAMLLASCAGTTEQNLVLNDSEYFEKQGVNVLVYSNLYTGGFNDEKNSGIEIIHHGVRTVQGGAVRLSSTPEQWADKALEILSTYKRKDGQPEVAKAGFDVRNTADFLQSFYIERTEKARFDEKHL